MISCTKPKVHFEPVRIPTKDNKSKEKTKEPGW